MKEDISTGEGIPRAFLVGIRDGDTPGSMAGSLARELAGLVSTLGLETAGQETVNVRETSARYGMGSGKARELAEKAASLEAGCIVFDREISPSQQKNWEELAGIPVIDRQELIIQIFASRARTREAGLQVRLAELTYALPRLQHKYIDLSRQRGGRYGTRGAGETRLETDRRQVEQRIHRLKEELKEVEQQRGLLRKQRERQGIPVCALVGYTNAGKSSLLNALTGAGVLEEDKLFATLDATARRLELPRGTQAVLVDTVGFIRRLPHSLVNAFRSTLEEINRADLLLNVVDAPDPDAPEYHGTTLSVLREIGAGDIPMITVLNKIDLLESAEALDAVGEVFPGAIPVSAKKGAGLPELRARMENALPGARLRFRFPPEKTDLAALLHRSGQVLSEQYGEFIEMEALVDGRTAGRLKEYQVHD